MRIACIYLPSFPLQTALVAAADAFDIQARPVAVVSQPAIGSPHVVECSRLARAAGVRPTMTASAARALVSDLQCLVADAAAERALLAAVADSLLAITPRVDLGAEPRGQHHCMYVEVPPGRRGAWFGSRVLELLAVFGLRGRVGIADDRFTAYVAASTSEGDDANLIESRSTHRGHDQTICVPRGGSAAFLAPQPISLLPLAPEVQHLLEARGVHTLGGFAALPPPSVSRSTTAWDSDFQALARGDGGVALDTYLPTGAVTDRIDIVSGNVGPAIETLARRFQARLDGRGSSSELRVRLHGASGVANRTLALDGERDTESLADALGRMLGDATWFAVDLAAELDSNGVPDSDDVGSNVATAPVASVFHAREFAPMSAPSTPGLFDWSGERPEHRRTRRGKQRPRIALGQARLFAGD